MPKKYFCMSIDATFTCNVIKFSFHIYCTQHSFKHVLSNFPEGLNKVFSIELNLYQRKQPMKMNVIKPMYFAKQRLQQKF